jgi:hypothetical protein
MESWEHRSVMHRIEKLVGMPAGGKRSGFGFTVANDAGNDEARIIEGGAECVRQRVSQFAAFMN